MTRRPGRSSRLWTLPTTRTRGAWSLALKLRAWGTWCSSGCEDAWSPFPPLLMDAFGCDHAWNPPRQLCSLVWLDMMMFGASLRSSVSLAVPPAWASFRSPAPAAIGESPANDVVREEVGYSEFLAAMMSSRIQVHEDLVRAAFQRYDEDDSGYISAARLQLPHAPSEECEASFRSFLLSEVENLRQVLTESLDSPDLLRLGMGGLSPEWTGTT